MAYKIIVLGFAFLSFGLKAQTTLITVNVAGTSTSGDAMVMNILPNTNYGSVGIMSVYFDDQTTPAISRSYLSFDLSQIPINAIVTSATLKLTPMVSSIQTNVSYGYNLERSMDSWIEGNLNSTNQPTNVYVSDMISVNSGDASSTNVHQINVKTHVQNMVNYPYNNHGWRIGLDDESIGGSGDYGLSFYTSNHSNSTFHPELDITYIMPIEITSTVSHSTNGNNDGSVDIAIAGGSGNYSKYNLYRIDINPDPTKPSFEIIVPIQNSNTVNNSITIGNLEPGLYRVIIRDALWSGSNNYNNGHFLKNYHFLVGEVGQITTCILASKTAVEDVQIKNNNGANAAANDDANINYKYVTSQLGIASTGTNSHGSTGASYDLASFINFNTNFSGDLEFTQADLHLRGWTKYYQTHTSSNESVYTAVTSSWDDDVLTWNSRPTIDQNIQVISLKTATPNGYTTDRHDLIDLNPLVTYWQSNPNYGFEMSLSNYNHPTYASRSHLTLGGTNQGYFEFSFKIKEPSILAYASLNRKMQGGYYKVPVADSILRVKYVEEYMDSDGDLNFVIKNKSGFNQAISSPSIVNGDNRIELDVSTLSTGFYILEVSNDKNEQFYLRFKVQ